MSSIQQKQIMNLLQMKLPQFKILEDYRPDYLRNNLTDKNFEIDIYIPSLNIGFEYQGAIHFNNIDKYKNDSDNSRKNDYMKEEIAHYKKNQSLIIVEIFETDLSGDIIQNIIKRIYNTQSYFYKKTLYTRCLKLEKFLNLFEVDKKNDLTNFYKMAVKLKRKWFGNKHKKNYKNNFWYCCKDLGGLEFYEDIIKLK